MKFVPLILLAVLAGLAGCGGDRSGDASSSSAAAAGEGGGAGLTPAQADSVARWNTVLARVGSREITATDVFHHMAKSVGEERARAQMSNPDMVQVGLGALVDQFLWARAAEDNGFRLSRDEQAQVDAFKAELLATRYVGDVIQYKADPSPEQVLAFYNDHQDRYLSPVRVGTRHILVGTEQEARQLKSRVDAGESFSDLARQYSRDENTRDIGGALGFVSRDEPILGLGVENRFADAVLPLSPGETTVINTRLGWHVARVERKEGGTLIPFEEVRPDLEAAFRRENFPTVYNDELGAVREKYNAGFVADGMEKFTGMAQNTGRLMAMAEEHPDPRGKIEFWRRVSFDFPGSKEAPHAQFLIAYTNLVELEDRTNARKALARLLRVFPDTPWARGGEYLLENLEIDDPTQLGTPEEILAVVESGK